MMNVKVLGAGCKRCEALLKSVKEALANKGVEAEVEYVADMKRIMNYGVMTLPALVVNEKVVSSGNVLKAKDVENLI